MATRRLSLRPLQQFGKGQQRGFLLFDHDSVHRKRGRDYTVHQIGLGKILAVNQDQRKIEKSILQAGQCLEKMSCRIVDRFFLFLHYVFPLQPMRKSRATGIMAARLGSTPTIRDVKPDCGINQFIGTTPLLV
jgi:hypothetical protein